MNSAFWQFFQGKTDKKIPKFWFSEPIFGHSAGQLPSWRKTSIFVIIFVITTKLIPPEHFLCDVAATGLSLFARKHAKEFVLQKDCFGILQN